jgi:hypothetical protein
MTTLQIYSLDKIYDKNIIAYLTLSGIVNNDNIIFSYDAYYNDYNVGNNKLITISNIILTGSNSNNYNLENINFIYGNIYPREIIPHLITNYKPYNGDTVAPKLYYTSLSGLISGDQITISNYRAVFDTPYIGYNKNIYITNLTIKGNDANNYFINPTMTITGNIVSSDLFINKLSNLVSNYYTTISGTINTPSISGTINYDYILSYNLNLLPNISNNITNIFNNAYYHVNNLNNQDVQFNIEIFNSNKLSENNYIFSWSDINQQNIVDIIQADSNKNFNSFQSGMTNIGNRFLEIVAHKIFGNAGAYIAFSNNNDYYTHDGFVWDHLINSLMDINHIIDVFEQYKKLTRYNELNTQFDFNGLTFSYPFLFQGSINLNDNPIFPLEILMNGKNVGGTGINNGFYNIPILIKFHA